MKRVQVLQLENETEPFEEWIRKLPAVVRARVDVFIDRVAYGGSKKNVKSLGDGIFEIKVNVGPGYRVYFGEDGRDFLLLISGGDKSRQEKDIKKAKKLWRHYVSNK